MTQRRTVYFLEYWTTSIGSISFDAFSCNSDYYTLYFRLTAVWSRHYNPISAADIGLSCRIQSLPSLQAFRLKLLQLQCLICRLFIKNCSIKQLLNSVFMNYQTSCRLLQPSALANNSAQLDIDNSLIMHDFWRQSAVNVVGTIRSVTDPLRPRFRKWRLGNNYLPAVPPSLD